MCDMLNVSFLANSLYCGKWEKLKPYSTVEGKLIKMLDIPQVKDLSLSYSK